MYHYCWWHWMHCARRLGSERNVGTFKQKNPFVSQFSCTYFCFSSLTLLIKKTFSQYYHAFRFSDFPRLFLPANSSSFLAHKRELMWVSSIWCFIFHLPSFLPTSRAKNPGIRDSPPTCLLLFFLSSGQVEKKKTMSKC